MQEPKVYTWLVPGRVVVAERPGGGGRSHRRARRDAEMAWWASEGVGVVVSGMRTRHGLLEAGLDGFRIHWHPLLTAEQGAREMPALVATTLAAMERGDGAVLVHVDLPGEWLAGVNAALRLALGLARRRGDALAQAAGDGLPVGEIASLLVGGRSRAAVAA